MPFASPHFTVEQVAERAWAAVATPSGAAVGNAGFAAPGGGAIVIDAFYTPAAARDLRTAAQQLAGPIELLVITHAHFDHYGGAQVFADVEIVATERTRSVIAEEAPKRIASLQAEMDSYIAELQGKGAPEWELDQARIIAAEIPVLEPTVPSTSFTGELDRGTACVLECGAGHTQSDSVVWLPEERVLFAADLIGVRSHPNLTLGDPEAWLAILDRLEELEPLVVVPGHGPPAGPEAIATVRHYIETLLRLADEPGDHEPAPEWTGWDFEEGFVQNLEALRTRRAA